MNASEVKVAQLKFISAPSQVKVAFGSFSDDFESGFCLVAAIV